MQLPSLDLLRDLSDQHVVHRLVEGPATRADLASATGLSKPTVSESVRRLGELGLVREAGRAPGGRGRAGTLVELDGSAGAALALHAGGHEVVGEVVDVRGRVRARHTVAVRVPVSAKAFDAALKAVVRTVAPESPGPLIVAAVSVADPVHPVTGRIVDLPGSPFIVGDVDVTGLVREHLDDVVDPLVVVDNDVNWAATAELRIGAAQGRREVLYVYLGAGVGAAVVVDGRVIRGARGTAGEIAQLPRPGAGTLVAYFAELGLCVPGTWSLDLPRLQQILADPYAVLREQFVEAIAQAGAGVTTVLDPEAVLFGGPIAGWPGVIDAVSARMQDKCVLPATVAPALLPEAPLDGVRLRAAEDLRDRLLRRVPSS